MVDTSTNCPPPQNSAVAQAETLYSSILTPGSSLNPTLLLILDSAFGLLLCVFLGLLVLTHGSVHIFVLIGIEACLWGTIKWVVHELKQIPPSAPESPTSSKKTE